MVRRPQTYVIDLDGVIYRGDQPLPHAAETVRELKRLSRKVFFLTNNSTCSREDYVRKLTGMDILASEQEIITSAYATALYLQQDGHEYHRAYVVGEAGLVKELESAGIHVAYGECQFPVDVVVVGLDRQFNYSKLTCAQQAILKGAEFIATNRDATYPIEEGVVIPGGGTMVSAIETASGVQPRVIGKPETYALEMLLKLAESTPNQSVMVGDRLETDILAGNQLGMATVLVTTGVSSKEDAVCAPTEMKPKRVISDLIELLDESWWTR